MEIAAKLCFVLLLMRPYSLTNRRRFCIKMDNLYPDLTPYEFDYTTEINKKMRVPERLSYNPGKPGTLGEGQDVYFYNNPVADLILGAKNPPEHSPGYSPDVLNNSDISSKILCSAQAHAYSQTNHQEEASANASAQASVVSKALSPRISSSSTSKEHRVANKPSSQSSIDQNYVLAIEQNLVKLEERISHLEFQQALFKGGLTLYILYRIMKWIIRNA